MVVTFAGTEPIAITKVELAIKKVRSRRSGVRRSGVYTAKSPAEAEVVVDKAVRTSRLMTDAAWKIESGAWQSLRGKCMPRTWLHVPSLDQA